VGLAVLETIIIILAAAVFVLIPVIIIGALETSQTWERPDDDIQYRD
jgi:hypothetical protein